MKDTTFSKIFNRLKSLEIDEKKLPLLIIGDRVINLGIHKAIWDYIASQKSLHQNIEMRKGAAADLSKGSTDKLLEENSHLFLLMHKMMVLNAFLEISFLGEEDISHVISFAEDKQSDFSRESLSNLKDIHHQHCLNLIEAINNISLDIEVNLHRPEEWISLGSFTIAMEDLRREFEEIKKFRYVVCQMINIGRELISVEARESSLEKEKSKSKKLTKTKAAAKEIDEGFKKIFFSHKGPDEKEQETLTFKSLEIAFEKKRLYLELNLEHGFSFMIYDWKKKPEMFLSDISEWGKYEKNGSVKFSYNKSRQYFCLLSDMDDFQLKTALTNGLKYYLKLKELFKRIKEVYLKLNLEAVWSDYKAIEITRSSWTDISVNYLEALIKKTERTAKSNPGGAIHILKTQIIGGILQAPSHRHTPPSSAWLIIGLSEQD